MNIDNILQSLQTANSTNYNSIDLLIKTLQHNIHQIRFETQRELINKISQDYNISIRELNKKYIVKPKKQTKSKITNCIDNINVDSYMSEDESIISKSINQFINQTNQNQNQNQNQIKSDKFIKSKSINNQSDQSNQSDQLNQSDQFKIYVNSTKIETKSESKSDSKLESNSESNDNLICSDTIKSINNLTNINSITESVKSTKPIKSIKSAKSIKLVKLSNLNTISDHINNTCINDEIQFRTIKYNDKYYLLNVHTNQIYDEENNLVG